MYLKKFFALISVINEYFADLSDDYVGRNRYKPLILLFFNMVSMALIVLSFITFLVLASKPIPVPLIILIIPFDILIIWVSAHVSNTSMHHLAKL